MKPAKPSWSEERWGEFRRVLVPVDFTLASVEAVRWSGLIAGRFGSRIHLLHVFAPHPLALNNGAELLMMSDADSAREATEQLRRLAREELAPELPVQFHIRHGQPAVEILRAVETLEADLLILAAHRRPLVARLVVGNTLARLLRHATCPALVVPVGKDAGVEAALWQDSEPAMERCQRALAL